jgi:hypothetical protein
MMTGARHNAWHPARSRNRTDQENPRHRRDRKANDTVVAKNSATSDRPLVEIPRLNVPSHAVL